MMHTIGHCINIFYLNYFLIIWLRCVTADIEANFEYPPIFKHAFANDQLEKSDSIRSCKIK